MSRRSDIDADALTAALLRAVKEARAAQTALEEAARGGDSGPSVEAIRERLALLAQLRDMGMEIVEALAEQLRAARDAAASEAPSLPLLIEAADAFARLSRAIRLIMMLETRAEEALRVAMAGRPPSRAIVATDAAPQAEREPTAPQSATDVASDVEETEGAEILAEGERVAEREPAERFADPEQTAAALRRAAALGLYDDIRAAARERLFLDRNYADFLTRPLEQLIPDLCRDLGLTAAALRTAGCAARVETPPPSRPPASPPGLGARVRRIPTALAGPSRLALHCVFPHPPDRVSWLE